MIRERMNVYITTSKKHLPYAYVSMYSLFENNADSEVYLYIVSEDLQEEDLVNEFEAAEKFGHHIIIVPFDDEMARNYTESCDEKHWPMATMSCYWLFHMLLPEDVDRIMAIESDTVTIGSLYNVYHVDMQGAFMACPGMEHKPKTHTAFVESLGGEGVTFVLSVYDVKKIRDSFKLEDIFGADAVVRNAAGRSQMEFTFGILFKGHIKYIPGEQSCLDENREYMKLLGWDYIVECEKKCKLLHFSSYEDYAKPWNPVELMPGYYYWWKYAKESPYFREYIERQWEIYADKNESMMKLKKNVSYRNILLAAYCMLTVVMALAMTCIFEQGIMGLLVAIIAVLIVLLVCVARNVVICLNKILAKRKSERK